MSGYHSLLTISARSVLQDSLIVPGGDSNSLRRWVVTVKACLYGQPVELCEAIQECTVVSYREELEVTSLGQPDKYRMVYSVQETRRIHDLLDLPIAITVTPLYHPTTTNLYKLDTRLAELVGRDYLAHPKYALTIVHAYARANNLYQDKNIICDSTLANIFGCSRIELMNLWREVYCLIKREEQKTISVIHQLTDFNKPSSSSLEVTVDEDFNIYPKNWSFSTKTHSRIITKTQSLCPKVAEKRSFKRNKSLEI